jgi:hypothetical protein
MTEAYVMYQTTGSESEPPQPAASRTRPAPVTRAARRCGSSGGLIFIRGARGPRENEEVQEGYNTRDANAVRFSGGDLKGPMDG